MTIFDRYLLSRYWHVFFIGFLALFGLYFVIDVFTNFTDFTDNSSNWVGFFVAIMEYYGPRACYFFGMIGGSLMVISSMVTMILVQKHGELNPVLSAGISTFRLLRTLLWGAVFVQILIIANQEFVIPRIAVLLQIEAGNSHILGNIDPVKDFQTDLVIAGKRLDLQNEKVEEAQFQLTPPKLADRVQTIEAREAVPYKNKEDRRVGWLLKNVSIPFEQLRLTETGKKYVARGPNPDELLIRTQVTFDQLYNRDSHYEFLSTWELIQRLRNPSASHRSLRSQNLYLHTRFTKWLLNLITVAVAVPFVVRKESRSLITNLATCSGVMTIIMGFNELFLYMGKVSLISPELAVWAPIITWGTAVAWFSGLVRT
ncbi:MAG: LptF/LptG family permease [Planctomycetes bacterium]|nr:LptF/LptG family permease [Planctomycetota bacterium]